MSPNNNTNRSRPAAVRALRRLSKAEALDQFRQRPAASVSAAARQWGCSRSTSRQWLSEFTAPPVATVSPPPGDGSSAIDAAMATAAPPPPAAMAAPEAFKAALCHLADLIETTTPQEILDSADYVEMLGLHQDSELVAAYVGAIETLAGAALKRDH
jgi:transposase-like protein